MRPFVDGSEHSDSNGIAPGPGRDWWKSINAITGSRDFVNASTMTRSWPPERRRCNSSQQDTHEYTSAELQKLAGVESIDYFPANSYVYRTWLKQHPLKRSVRASQTACYHTSIAYTSVSSGTRPAAG
eukprot:4265454-Pyramimonas_sp.AAC.1